MGRDRWKNGVAGGSDWQLIPLPARKMVKNLKEVIRSDCTDWEIYVVLRDCNMDPNEAFQRLVSQDNFHEVKSRRERKKEMKEMQEPKTRANNRTSYRRGRGDSEQSFGRNGSRQINSNGHGKATYWKEKKSVASTTYSASSPLCATRQTGNEQPSLQSHFSDPDNRRQAIGTSHMNDSSWQPFSGSQSTWVPTTFGVAMADIVRMGKPQSDESQLHFEKSYTPQDAFPPNSAIHQDLHFSNVNMTGESGKKSNQHDFDSEWLVNDPITAFSDTGATMYSNQSYLHGNKANLPSNCWSDDIIASESNAAWKNLTCDHVSSDQASNKQIFMNDSGGASQHDSDLWKVASSDAYRLIYEPREGISKGSNISFPNPRASFSDDAIKAVSSAAVNLQQLSLGEERAVTSTKDNCGLVLPDYIQAFSADCSHLSFGTYNSGKSKALSGLQASHSLKNDMEETLTTSNSRPSSMHLNSKGVVHCNEEQLEFDIHTQRAAADSRNYNPPIFSLAEPTKIDISDAAAHGHDYVFPSSINGSSFKNIRQQGSASSFVIDPNVRTLPLLPSEVQSDSNSIPSDLLAAPIQSMEARDSAALLASQSISSIYSSCPSSIKNPTTSMSEVSNSGAFVVSHPSSQALLGANLASEPASKEHLSGRSYSQNGYLAIPQGHTHTLSALQQAYPDGNVFHESDTGIKYNIPHNRNASMSSLPFPGSYKGFQSLGNSADIPGTFPHNLSAGPGGRNGGYDDLLCPQYRNGEANLNQFQQNDGFDAWAYGHDSRTMSTILDSAYYSLEGSNHQLDGYQQGQQQTQHFDGYQQGQQHSELYEAMEYPSIYNSQAGNGVEEWQQQQPENPRDMILNGSQGPSANQLPKFWQHNY